MKLSRTMPATRSIVIRRPGPETGTSPAASPSACSCAFSAAALAPSAWFWIRVFAAFSAAFCVSCRFTSSSRRSYSRISTRSAAAACFCGCRIEITEIENAAPASTASAAVRATPAGVRRRGRAAAAA